MKDSRLEVIGSAAAGIAHDVNNQLILIVNHLEVRDVAGARRAAERCAALTGSLLAYCKQEPVAVEPICPGSFLKAFAADLRLSGGIELHLIVPDLLPAIMADALALTRVLTNLVSNACDAMDHQGTLRITASPLVIEVSDSGPGIRPEVAGKIFEPFFTTRGARGTGLGLSIVRDLMWRQGGSVTLHSRAGDGARFKLAFRAD
ncbi:MAG TPA: ATP-binding protein [Bryobacteraceae bacterium]|jgi:signal transduction histidine kinase|nr:ATP-binding protein [Bryobacteraceae bacterium]